MAATDAHKIAVANAIAGMGNTIKPHSGDPGAAGTSNAIGSLSGTTAWGGAVAGAGGDAGKAVATGSAVNFTIPASTTVSHFSVWNGGTFLRSYALDASITVNHFSVWNGGTFLRSYALDASITVNASGSAPVDITPKIKYTA